MKMIESWLRRLHALFDKSAWMLIAPALAAMFFVDPPLARTFSQWGLFFLVQAGGAVIISRIVFPHLDLRDYLDAARGGNLAAGAVASAIIVFVGLLLLASVVWVKGT